MINNQSTLLDEKICFLKAKQEQQFIILKEHLQTTGESLKPINILKNTATEVVSFVKAEGNILNKMIEFSIRQIGKKGLSLIGNNKIGNILSRFIK